MHGPYRKRILFGKPREDAALNLFSEEIGLAMKPARLHIASAIKG